VKDEGSKPLRDAIEAVSEGRAVDWESEKSSRPELGDTFEALRVLEEIGRVHRGAGVGSSRGAGAEPSGAASASARARAGRRDGRSARLEPAARATLSEWGPLRILEKIGEGSFGEVYRAFDPGLQIQVALKLWRPVGADPETYRELIDEAQRLARVHHPNVLTVHGVDKRKGRVGMWTDLIRGHTLEQLLERDGPFAALEAAVIGMELCAALAALHTMGVVHRDLKSTNVMREQGGRIVLMDFGTVSEAAGQRGAKPAGTPLAMAPEVLSGEPATVASDLYSLGVLLYRLVTAAYPVEADTLAELSARHARGEIAHLRDRRPDLPRSFVDVVELALSPDPERRHRSAGAFERALAQTLDAAALPRGASKRPAANNLPQPLTSFVGRQRELESCLALIPRSRIFTLTGSPGSGKTRLGLRLAEVMLDSGLEAVWFVDLAPLVERAHVERALASAAGISEGRGAAPLFAVAESIGARSCLLLLDNCEHLVEECGAIATTLIRSCPNLRVVATSREALGVPGEQLYGVPPLTIPDAGALAAPAAVMSSDAGRLFVERASLVDPALRLTERNARDVAEICRRLDGIPLALELAAALARVLSPEEIRERLDSQIVLRANPGSATAERNQTLQAAFEWSYGMLSEAERAFLGRLSVFSGRWTLAAATAVCGGGLEDMEVVLLLSRLADKSLVLTEHVDEVRTAYRLLETVRQFAADKLAERGGADAVRHAHLDYYLSLAESAEGGLEGPGAARWLSRLDVEHENLLAAVRWALEGAAAPEMGLRLAGALWRYWYTRGEFTLGCATLERALMASGAEGHEIARAKALWGAGYIAMQIANSGKALPWFEESLALAQRSGDRAGVSRALKGLGIVAVDRRDYAGARRPFEDSLAIDRELGNARELASSLNNVGAVAWRQGDYETARMMHEEGAVLARACGATMSVILNLLNLTCVCLRLARPDDARKHLRECLPLVRELGAKYRGAEAMELAAETLTAPGAAASAVRLYGAAEGLREELHSPAETPWHMTRDAAVARLLEILGQERYEAARSEGRTLGFEAALTLAADELRAG